MMTNAITIDSPKYGERVEFETLAEAQETIRACGGDFARTTLTAAGGVIYDEDHEKIGTATFPDYVTLAS